MKSHSFYVQKHSAFFILLLACLKAKIWTKEGIPEFSGRWHHQTRDQMTWHLNKVQTASSGKKRHTHLLPGAFSSTRDQKARGVIPPRTGREEPGEVLHQMSRFTHHFRRASVIRALESREYRFVSFIEFLWWHSVWKRCHNVFCLFYGEQKCIRKGRNGTDWVKRDKT